MRSFLLTVLAAAGMIAVVLYFSNKEPKYQPQQVHQEKARKSPCELPVTLDTVFNDMWIGMPRSNYKHRKTSIEFTSSLTEGKINWEPIWKNDTLGALRLRFHSTNLGSDELLAMEAFQVMFYKRLRKCDIALNHDADIKTQVIVCGRNQITHYMDHAVIYIEDLCYGQIEDEKREREKALEVEKSKALFK